MFDSEQSIEDDSEGLSVSDLMAGLMMVFLFISVAFMRFANIDREEAVNERDKIEAIADQYINKQQAIFITLNNEFRDDFNRWGASLDESSLTVTFDSPDILFESNSSQISYDFQRLLDDFFPRFVRALDPYRDFIREIRIEGHTSSVWAGAQTQDQAYFKNMELSQDRTRSVLEYTYRLVGVFNDRDWMTDTIAAVGHSFAHTIKDESGVEDNVRSRRVAFRIVTNADREIRRILGVTN